MSRAKETEPETFAGLGGGCPVSRRRFFAAAGVTAGGLMLPNVARADTTAVAAAGGNGGGAGGIAVGDRFGRMFGTLPPFASQSNGVEAALMELGKPGGLMDARDTLSAGPKALLGPDTSLNGNAPSDGAYGSNPDNPSQFAGTTFLGQFLDHDITLDSTSRLGQPSPPEATRNGRTPALDLDSVYGAGPVGSPMLYADGTHLATGHRGPYEDVPRLGDGTAVIGDGRNDENLVVNGLHAAYLKFHNRVVDDFVTGSPADADAFLQARQIVTWHHQWMVVHEFLVQIVGQAMVDDVLANGRRFYRPDAAYIPVEFQGAVYRFGHSQVRPSYRVNFTGDGGGQRFAFVFDPSQEGKASPNDMRGGIAGPDRQIGWATFFPVAGQTDVLRRNKRIDEKLSSPLFTLPHGVVRGPEPIYALAQRNLLRHLTWKLPSGQALAAAMGATPLAQADLSELSALGQGLDRSTPLWYYVLREAHHQADGLHLGEVGGRIVAEVFLGMLQLDPASYLNAAQTWTPTLGRDGGKFDMQDLLSVAGVTDRR